MTSIETLDTLITPGNLMGSGATASIPIPIPGGGTLQGVGAIAGGGLIQGGSVIAGNTVTPRIPRRPDTSCGSGVAARQRAAGPNRIPSPPRPHIQADHPTRRSERVSAILDRLAATGTVDVNETAADLGVSLATIRRDLALLDEQNLLTRTHGGAVARDVSYELPVRYRDSQSRSQKQAIARAALRGLPSGPYVVAVNGGTTTSEVARLLATRTELTVVTNALNIAAVLVNRPRVKLVVTGGVARSNSYELVGPWAEGTVGRVNIGTAFIGIDGISASGGLSTHDEVEAHINAVMIRQADRVVVVADGSKIGRSLLAHVAPLSGVDELVTDPSADSEELAAIAAHGVKVTIAVAGGR